MSHVAHSTNLNAGYHQEVVEKMEPISASTYFITWMTLGTITGGVLGYWEVFRAPGTFLPAVAMISAVTGSVVGAAIGQLVAGLFHVVINRSLDED